MLEEANDRVFVAPAAGLPINMLRLHKEFGLNWSSEKITSMESEIETVTTCMRDLHRRGVRVLPGGDYWPAKKNPPDALDIGMLFRLDAIACPQV